MAGGFDLLAPWLLITYGLVLVVILVGALYHGPHDKKLEDAATESSDDQPSRELLALITGTSGRRLVNVVDGLLWAAIIHTMVVKPFGLG